MHFSAVATLGKRKAKDLLVLPFWQEKGSPQAAAECKSLQPLFERVLKTKDFKGKEGEFLLLYVEGQLEPRLALLGLGDKQTVENLRRAYASVTKHCMTKKIETLNALLPKLKELSAEEIIRGVSEGLLLPNYAFTSNKTENLKESLIKEVTLIGTENGALATRTAHIFEGVTLTRDLVNGNADDITPQHLSELALSFAKKYPHVTATVFDKKRIEKEKMGLILAVNRGSARDPAFIILEYKGDPKSKEHTVIVGKGITYDTGGLNLKPTGSMETMKSDMAGAAVGFGTIVAASALKLKANITVVIPSTENCIGSKSYKPGDSYISYSGKTVEVDNTDAEGRLVLADALAYAEKHLKPTRMIDLATLTGAIVVALGSEAAGLLSNNDALANALLEASQETGERLWRLPLFDDYKDQLKSDVADIKNSGGRGAGAITAAWFLRCFVDKTPWAHLDIAGVTYHTDAKRYYPKLATGFGVRTLIEFLENPRM